MGILTSLGATASGQRNAVRGRALPSAISPREPQTLPMFGCAVTVTDGVLLGETRRNYPTAVEQ